MSTINKKEMGERFFESDWVEAPNSEPIGEVFFKFIENYEENKTLVQIKVGGNVVHQAALIEADPQALATMSLNDIVINFCERVNKSFEGEIRINATDLSICLKKLAEESKSGN